MIMATSHDEIGPRGSPKNARLRIIVADDQPEMLTNLKLALESAFDVVGTAEDGRTLIAAAQRLRPDVVLTDINMPVMDGIAATRELLKMNPNCLVIYHTCYNDSAIISAALSAGALGYLLKGTNENLITSIQSIISRAQKSHPGFDLTDRRLPPSDAGSGV